MVINEVKRTGAVREWPVKSNSEWTCRLLKLNVSM